MSCTATVKWFDRKKGIGFATPAEGGDDIFIHRRNFTTPFTLDENDEIFYDVGEYEGRATAVKISVPADKPAKTQQRRRGRNATKRLDEEAETMASEQEGATGAEQAAGEGEEAATGRPGGGRDSKTRRRPVSARPSRSTNACYPFVLPIIEPLLRRISVDQGTGNRDKRNDKGVAAKGSVSDGQQSSRRNNARSDAKHAHADAVANDGS